MRREGSPARPRLEYVAATSWRGEVERALARGLRFRCAYAGGEGERSWSALFGDGHEELLLRTFASGDVPAVDSVVDLVEAADWDEREAHDLGAIEFEGRASTRPLLDHSQPSSAWAVPVAGAGVEPGGGRPGPRGDHRVRSFPLPRGRRADPSRRPAALLQAPGAGAGGGGDEARGWYRDRPTRLRSMRCDELGGIRPGL